MSFSFISLYFFLSFNNVSCCFYLTFLHTFLPQASTWDGFLFYERILTNNDVFTVTGTWKRCCPPILEPDGCVGQERRRSWTPRIEMISLSWDCPGGKDIDARKQGKERGRVVRRG